MSLKIAIVGAGGVGGYLAAKLTQINHDVTLIARGENLDAIRKNGLKVIEYKQDEFTVYPYTVNSLDDEIYDIIFITTKSCDYESACKAISNAISKNTLIIPLSDVIDVSSLLLKYLPTCIIGDGLIHVISELKSPGIIQRKSFTFYLQISCYEENINLKILEQILNYSDLRTTASKSLCYEKWKKYLFIASLSMLTTYFDKPIGYVFNEKLELLLDILLEIQKVANAKDVNITNQDIEKTIKQVSHVEYERTTDMQVDAKKQKKTEFHSLVTYIVQEANEFNIQIPQIKKIYILLKEKLLINNQIH